MISQKEFKTLQDLVSEKNKVSDILKAIVSGRISPKMTSEKGGGFGKNPFADSINYFNKEFIEPTREMRTLSIDVLGRHIEKIDLEIAKYVATEGVIEKKKEEEKPKRTILHVCLSIRGALRGRKFDDFMHDDGSPMSRDEAFEFLCDQLAMGRMVLPMTECPDFDYQTGCPGHAEEIEEGEDV